MNNFNRLKYVLLALCFLLPTISYGQKCNSNWGTGVIKSVSSINNTVVVVMSTSIVLTGQISCGIRPTPLSPIGQSQNLPTSITKDGVTVDFTKVVIRTADSAQPIGCQVQGNGTLLFFYQCNPGNQGAGATVNFDVQYTLVGKSTSPTTLFQPSITTFSDSSQLTTSNTNTNYPDIKSLASSAPTCSTTVQPQNLMLSNIPPTQLSGAVGSFTTAGQNTFKLSVTCPSQALSKATTFIPTFQMTRSLLVSDPNGAFDISRTAISTEDKGFGFRVLDPLGGVTRHNVAVTNAGFPFTTPGSLQSISKTFTVQYAKTLQTITPGAATTNITILMNIQ